MKVTQEESIQLVGSSSTVEYYPIFGPYLAQEKLAIFVTKENGEADCENLFFFTFMPNC